METSGKPTGKKMANKQYGIETTSYNLAKING